MSKFIIGYGFAGGEAMRDFEAKDYDAAYAEAVKRTKLQGGDDPADFSDTFAEAWTDWRAWDLGLLAPEEEREYEPAD